MKGYTILKFKRKLNTRDLKGDVEIKNETTFLIFAWNKNDPANDDFFQPHSPTYRKMKSVDLLNYQASLSKIDLPPATFTVDLQLKNVILIFFSILITFILN